MIVRPGCATWTIVPEPPRHALRDPDTGEPGVRIEFRADDGTLAGAEHRGATMFTWWDGLPEGIGRGGHGSIVLRTCYRPAHDGPHVIGAGGVGRLTLSVNGTEVAAGRTDVPADPVEAMVRPGEIRATVDLAAGREAEIEDLAAAGRLAAGPGGHPARAWCPRRTTTRCSARPSRPRGPPTPPWWWSGPAPATESEGFDRPGLALPGRQDELVRRVAAVNDRTIVVVNAGMPVLMPWADQVAAVGYAWLPGQAMGAALADVLLGQAEPGGRLPVTLPAAEADCPVLHAVPADGRLEYREGLLIGYRGYDRAGTKPRFPFGHGLGYTTWAYESAAADAPVVAPDERPRRDRRAPQHRPADRPRGRPGLPGAARRPIPAARCARWRPSPRSPQRPASTPRPGSPSRPGRSPATTRRPGPGSARRASSPSASAGPRLTCRST